MRLLQVGSVIINLYYFVFSRYEIAKEEQLTIYFNKDSAVSSTIFYGKQATDVFNRLLEYVKEEQ